MKLTRREFLKISGVAFISPQILPENLFSNTIYAYRIPVLLYHEISNHFKKDYCISPANFAAQMEWLYSTGYKTIFVRELNNALNSSNEKIAVITFDDGSLTFMDYAFPLLEEYNFTATMNLVGSWVGGKRLVLSWDECRYLKDSGLVDFGCHSFNLHDPSRGVPEDVIGEDLIKFQEIMERELGKRAEVLAWPYGIYNKKSIKIARKAGFKYLLTSNEGYLNKESDPYEIPRLNINDKLDLISFQQYVGGKT